MNRRELVATAALALSLTLVTGCASGSGRSLSAPRRAEPAMGATAPAVSDPEFLEQYASTFRFSLGTPRAIHPVPGGDAVLFLRSGPRSFVQDLYEYDVKSGKERVLLTADKVLAGGEEKLTAEELARRERMRSASRGIASYELSKDARRILVPLSGRLFVIERASGEVRELKSQAGYPIDPRFCEDASMVAAVRNGDLYVIDVASGSERRLTTGATPTLTNALAEFVAQEEMDRREGYWWSPDSQLIAYEQADTSGVEVLHIADPVNPAKEAQAWPYPRPGRKNADVKLGLVASSGGTTVWVQWDHARYPYLCRVVWPKKGPLSILVQNREQTEEALLAVEPGTGSTSPLLVESDAAWINLHGDCPKWLADGSGFLWVTERNAFTQLELRDAAGKLVRPLTDASLGLVSLIDVDQEARAAYVVAAADPTDRQVWRIPLDAAGAAPGCLTPGPGVHAVSFAHDFSAWVASHQTLNAERSWVVHRRDAGEAGRLTSVAERAPLTPRVELTTVRSPGGEREYHAAIVRPRSFQSGRRYPVIASVYAGPGHQTVTSAGQSYLLTQWIADQGFIVVTLDGRGTTGRGREWERAIRGDLITIPLHDQVEGLQSLGRKCPELDLSRVGVYGWSFGGYFSAMAVMQRPDIYRAGVAGAPVCDWLDYDTFYTERFLGLPDANPEGYKRSSVLTYCKDLRVPLLVVHGTADDNVYFMHSLKMTDALFRSRRPFDFLALPGFTHMVPDPVVTRALYTRIAGFFIEQLRP